MEIKINKEIRHYQESVIMGLTARQLICSLLAIAVAVGLYFLFKDIAGRETISWVCILAAAPFGAAGFFRYNGMTVEKFLMSLISAYINSGVRVYKTENYYLNALSLTKRRTQHDKDAKEQSAQ